MPYALLFILMHATCSVSFTLRDFVNLINVGITNHEDPHYVVFFIILLLPHRDKYSQHWNILSFFFFLTAKFHTHEKLQGKL